jgi:hypothetical protein
VTGFSVSTELALKAWLVSLSWFLIRAHAGRKEGIALKFNGVISVAELKFRPSASVQGVSSLKLLMMEKANAGAIGCRV